MKKELLKQAIEEARTELNQALEDGKGTEEYYLLSVKLDKLIEDYIDICESKKA